MVKSVMTGNARAGSRKYNMTGESEDSANQFLRNMRWDTSRENMSWALTPPGMTETELSNSAF